MSPIMAYTSQPVPRAGPVNCSTFSAGHVQLCSDGTT